MRASALLALLLAGCAWSNRDNRPVWNAFEEHLVPEDDAAFVASLPLTVPGGVLAILTDTFVVHPAQVVDDAYDDAADVWKHMEWEKQYYTELVLVAFRTVGTPLVFAGSFVGRSLFDISDRGTAADREAEKQRANREVAKRWLDEIAGGGGSERVPWGSRGMGWSPELQASFEAARAKANAPQRLQLYRAAHLNHWEPVRDDPALGLRDPDPVVRYEVLQQLRRDARVPDDVQKALRNDPVEMIRWLAHERFPAPG